MYSKVTEYNWYELQTISRLPEDQILLMFALYVGFQNRLGNCPIMIQNKLFLDKIYNGLFNRKFLIRTDQGIFSNYICSDPQNYVRNLSFIHSKVSPIVKLEYLYILSQRSLKNQNDWIPADYVEPQYHTNVFIYKRDGKLYFPWEVNQNKPKPKLEKKIL